MKNLLEEAVASVDLKNPNSVAAAANALLSENAAVSAGDTVACIDDTIHPIYGRGKVKSIKNGIATVTSENGTEYQAFSSLLLAV